VSIDHKGFVWIGGNGEKDGQYLKFTREGKFVLQIGKQGDQTNSNDLARLGKPADAEVDPETNEVYIADGYFNHRVIVFDADSGAYKRHWGRTATSRRTKSSLPIIRPLRNSATRFIASRSRGMASSTSATAPTTASRCSARTAAS
jgi:DNA-binding beta-propeller fold protein YncE